MIRKSIPFIFALAFGLIGFSAYTLLSQSTPLPSQENPQETSSSIEQQKQLVIQYINESNSVNAKTSLEQLITDYGNSAEVVPAVYEIAEIYRSKAQFASAITSCQFILANFPESEKAIWAQRSLAASYIGLKDYESAKAASDKLITDYSNNPNIAQAVFEVADTFCWFGKNKEAQELYQKVIDSWPGAEHSMWAQMGLVISYIADGNDAAALVATNKLAANYASNEKLPEALTYIAARYVWSKKYEKGLDIYSYIIEQFPGNIWAEGAKFESAKVSVYPFIDANDEPNTLAAIDSLINGFKEKAELPAAVYDFAARVDWKNKNEPNDFTQKLCQVVIEAFPNTPQATLAQMLSSRLDIISLIDANDDPNAFAAIDIFIADYNNLASSAEEVFRVAQRYYSKAMNLKHWQGNAEGAAEYFYNSIEILERIIRDLPQSSTTSNALFGIAVMYSQELGETEKGIEIFEGLIAQFPEHSGIEMTHFLLSKYYGVLKKEGKIAPDEADVIIEQNLKIIVEQYPNSDIAGNIALQLAYKCYETEQWQQAAEHFEIYLDKFPERIGTIVQRLGISYEKMGNPESAKELYRAYISMAEPGDALLKTITARLGALEGHN